MVVRRTFAEACGRETFQYSLEIVGPKSEVDIVVVHALASEVTGQVFGQVQLQARSTPQPYAPILNGGRSRRSRPKID
jgi:hypothetical protein